MKKQIPILSTLILVAVLSACGTQSTQTLPEPATQTAASVEPTQTLASTDTPLSTSTATVVAETATQPAAAGVSFADDIMPIFNNSCNKCHGVEQVKEGLDMTSYETLMAGSRNGAVITAGNANDSFLVQQLVEGEMPKRGQKLTAEQIQVIADWINAGALNN